jgi:peroxiredoxin (alkyl hydroperoxide reductase subunit C)
MAGQQQAQTIRLGCVAPNFEADTTQGRINFYDYIGDGWAVLFCIPDDFTPVATTELVMFAYLQQQFTDRNVKFVVISTKNRPTEDGEYVPHTEWVTDVNDISPSPVKFPIASDADGSLSRLYNVLDKKDVDNLNADDNVATGLAFKSRTLFIIGPEWKSKHHVRLVLNYPAAVGFNTSEVLRALGALQTSDSASIRTPANWVPGGDVVVPPSMTDEEAKKMFGDFKPVKSYLRFAEIPSEPVAFTDLSFRQGALVSRNIVVGDGKMKVKEDAHVYDV